MLSETQLCRKTKEKILIDNIIIIRGGTGGGGPTSEGFKGDTLTHNQQTHTYYGINGEDKRTYPYQLHSTIIINSTNYNSNSILERRKIVVIGVHAVLVSCA